jgi:hypothetical protein
MKSEITLETHLRHWTPRPPSAKLKSRIFSPTPVAKTESTAPGWAWLAPVSAAFVFSLAALTSPEVRLNPAHATATLGSLADNSSLAYSAADKINVVSAILEWTNSRRSPSSMGPFVLYNTNGLNR